MKIGHVLWALATTSLALTLGCSGGGGGDGGGLACSPAQPCEAGFECMGGRCVPDDSPDELCLADDLSPPCNGCPAGTEIPTGFVCAPAGTFTQGESGVEEPRQVTLTRPFFIQINEVTQGEWRALMGDNPARFAACGDACPVESMSWEEAVAYANARSAAEGLAPCYGAQGALLGGATPYDCKGYRLPTEAEWEYAYRAGTQTAFYWGDDEASAGDFAWFRDNGGETTHPVGTKLPNGWGLHDMAGNVYEWVHDVLEDDSAESVTDPWGPQPAENVVTSRVFRGGSWFNAADLLRAAYRNWYAPGDRLSYLGFRLAKSGIL